MTLQGHPGNRVALFASWGPHGQDGYCSRGVAFAAAPRPFVLLRAGPPVWDRPKRWYHPLDRGDVAQLGERGVRNAEVGSSILLVSTKYGGQTCSVPLSFCLGTRVLARVRASLRRAPPPQTPRCQVVFRSQMPPILCFCEGGLRNRSSNGAGFRLLVREGTRLHAGDPTQSDVWRPATCSSRTSR